MVKEKVRGVVLVLTLDWTLVLTCAIAYVSRHVVLTIRGGCYEDARGNGTGRQGAQARVCKIQGMLGTSS